MHAYRALSSLLPDRSSDPLAAPDDVPHGASLPDSQKTEALVKQQKLHVELIRELEQEIMDLRAAKSQLRVKVDELERVCRLQSIDINIYKGKLEEALRDLDSCRSAATSHRNAIALSQMSEATALSLKSQELRMDRIKHDAEVRDMSHKVMLLERNAQEKQNMHAQELDLLQKRIRAVMNERDVLLDRVTRLTTTSDALRMSERFMRTSRDEARSNAELREEELQAKSEELRVMQTKELWHRREEHEEQTSWRTEAENAHKRLLHSERLIRALEMEICMRTKENKVALRQSLRTDSRWALERSSIFAAEEVDKWRRASKYAQAEECQVI